MYSILHSSLQRGEGAPCGWLGQRGGLRALCCARVWLQWSRQQKLSAASVVLGLGQIKAQHHSESWTSYCLILFRRLIKTYYLKTRGQSQLRITFVSTIDLSVALFLVLIVSWWMSRRGIECFQSLRENCKTNTKKKNPFTPCPCLFCCLWSIGSQACRCSRCNLCFAD